MKFLVRTELAQPLPKDPDERADLLSDERAEGRRLRDLGVIADMWRVPGRQANIAVMVAEDATQLHEFVTGLPLWPFTAVTVEAVADHPLMDSDDAPL